MKHSMLQILLSFIYFNFNARDSDLLIILKTCRFNVLTAIEAKGIGTFIGTFCLPALIFGSLCKLNLMSVNWGFITAILIAKATIFFAVLIGMYF
jgi:predicted permease